MAYLNAIAMYLEIGDSDLELAKIENALGEVHRQTNEYPNARRSFLNAMDLLEPLLKSKSNADEAKFEMARTLYLLAKRRPHDPDQRFRQEGEGPPRGNRLPQPPPDGRRGDRQPPPRGPRDGRPQGNPRDAEDLIRAITLLEELNLNDSAHPEYRFLQALCYREKAELEREDNDQQSIDLLGKLCEHFLKSLSIGMNLA